MMLADKMLSFTWYMSCAITTTICPGHLETKYSKHHWPTLWMGTLEDHLNLVTICASHTHTVLQQGLVLPEEWPRLVASWSLSPCSLSPWPLSLELTRSASWNAELQPQTAHNHFYQTEVRNPLERSVIFPKPSYHLKHLHSREFETKWNKSSEQRGCLYKAGALYAADRMHICSNLYLPVDTSRPVN